MTTAALATTTCWEIATAWLRLTTGVSRLVPAAACRSAPQHQPEQAQHDHGGGAAEQRCHQERDRITGVDTAASYDDPRDGRGEHDEDQLEGVAEHELHRGRLALGPRHRLRRGDEGDAHRGGHQPDQARSAEEIAARAQHEGERREQARGSDQGGLAAALEDQPPPTGPTSPDHGGLRIPSRGQDGGGREEHGEPAAGQCAEAQQRHAVARVALEDDGPAEVTEAGLGADVVRVGDVGPRLELDGPAELHEALGVRGGRGADRVEDPAHVRRGLPGRAEDGVLVGGQGGGTDALRVGGRVDRRCAGGVDVVERAGIGIRGAVGADDVEDGSDDLLALEARGGQRDPVAGAHADLVGRAGLEDHLDHLRLAPLAIQPEELRIDRLLVGLRDAGRQLPDRAARVRKPTRLDRDQVIETGQRRDGQERRHARVRRQHLRHHLRAHDGVPRLLQHVAHAGQQRPVDLLGGAGPDVGVRHPEVGDLDLRGRVQGLLEQVAGQVVGGGSQPDTGGRRADA